MHRPTLQFLLLHTAHRRHLTAAMSKKASYASPPAKRLKIGHSSQTPTYAELELRLTALDEENTKLKEENTKLKEENTNLKREKENIVRCMRKYGVAWNGITTVELSQLTPKAVHYKVGVPDQFIKAIPEMVWKKEIIHLFNLKDLAFLRCTNTFFEPHWDDALRQNLIRVPQDCPTVERAMTLAKVLSDRKEYSETDPLRVKMEKGVHNIVGGCLSEDSILERTMSVTCSYITFVGMGKDETTVNGGFYVGKGLHHVKFEELVVTNPCRTGSGLEFEGSSNVGVLNCVVKECGNYGMVLTRGATATAIDSEFMENHEGVILEGANTKASLSNCTIHHNGTWPTHNAFAFRMAGLTAWYGAVVDLHGTKTDIHSNKQDGIVATDNGKINIHLSSQHNTTHDNDGDDRRQADGGSIANINADGTFTHVEEVHDDEEEDEEEVL